MIRMAGPPVKGEYSVHHYATRCLQNMEIQKQINENDRYLRQICESETRRDHARSFSQDTNSLSVHKNTDPSTRALNVNANARRTHTCPEAYHKQDFNLISTMSVLFRHGTQELKRGPGTIALPDAYESFINQAEDYFANPECASLLSSSFTAAEWLVEHFLEALTRCLAEPAHPSSRAFINALKDNIIKELQFRKRTASQPRNNPWGRQRGFGLWLEEQIKLVALYLAYRVEVGQTSSTYNHWILMHLAALSEKGSV